MGWSPFRPTGLTHHQPGISFKGYTLFSPIGGDSAYLLNMDGEIVHRWRVPGFRIFCPKLLPNGKLMALCQDAAMAIPRRPEPGAQPPPGPDVFRLIGGANTDLLELDWDGNITWRYTNLAIHHDFALLPNGNVVIPEFLEIPPELAKRVRGGVRRPGEKLPPLISDDFIEVNREGKVVKRTSLWKLLDPAKDPIGPLERRWEWTHTNSVDVTAEGHLLFSCRTNSRVGILDRDAERITWKYGDPNTFYQHHASSLPNGNVLIFDNGMNRLHDLSYSRIVEVNPRNSTVTWQYEANPRQQFFSGHISGAHRLPNGNTLICEGTSGRLFEVTASGEIAWEFINPMHHALGPMRQSWVFRAYRYGPDYGGLADRSLDPAAHADLNRLHGLESR
ncbi:MAG: aryl-sulfate sulfotransferase [Dehalococcoidia bacterium]